MSSVTGVMLCASIVEDCGSDGEDGELSLLFEQINGWLLHLAGDTKWQLRMLQSGFGGNKHPQVYAAGGGFNCFPEDDFAAFVLGLPWQNPDNVVLVMQPEDGPTRVFRPPAK